MNSFLNAPQGEFKLKWFLTKDQQQNTNLQIRIIKKIFFRRCDSQFEKLCSRETSS